MNLLKTILGWPWVQKFINGQLSTAGAAGGLWIVTHIHGLSYSAQQIDGALVCLGAVALQVGENYVRTGNIAGTASSPTQTQGATQ